MAGIGRCANSDMRRRLRRGGRGSAAAARRAWFSSLPTKGGMFRRTNEWTFAGRQLPAALPVPFTVLRATHRSTVLSLLRCFSCCAVNALHAVRGAFCRGRAYGHRHAYLGAGADVGYHLLTLDVYGSTLGSVILLGARWRLVLYGSYTACFERAERAILRRTNGRGEYCRAAAASPAAATNAAMPRYRSRIPRILSTAGRYRAAAPADWWRTGDARVYRTHTRAGGYAAFAYALTAFLWAVTEHVTWAGATGGLFCCLCLPFFFLPSGTRDGGV